MQETTSTLDGITRRTVCTLPAEITPVIEVDRRRIGNGHPGPLTCLLQQAFFACVRGEYGGHADWLIPVWVIQVAPPIVARWSNSARAAGPRAARSRIHR